MENTTECCRLHFIARLVNIVSEQWFWFHRACICCKHCWRWKKKNCLPFPPHGSPGTSTFWKGFFFSFWKTEQESQEIMRVIENKAVDLFPQDAGFLRTEAFFSLVAFIIWAVIKCSEFLISLLLFYSIYWFILALLRAFACFILCLLSCMDSFVFLMQSCLASMTQSWRGKEEKELKVCW